MFSLKNTVLSVLVLSVASLAAASPLSHPTQELSSRSVNKTVRYCSNKNYGGTCLTNSWKQVDPCMNVDPSLLGQVSSFTALDSLIQCKLYTGRMCTGREWTLYSGRGGAPDLSTNGSNFDNLLSSYSCAVIDD